MRALAIVGLAAAAICVPAAIALAPDDAGTDTSQGTDPAARPTPASPAPPSPFTLAQQTAERTLQDPALGELSGLAASQRHPGVLYGINDSGGGPVVFAIDSDGNTAARLTLAGLQARDWEAIAPGRDSSGNPVLWIGDIGDNLGNEDRVRIVRITEPAMLADQEVAWESFWVGYPDGPHNAEALVVDPGEGTLSIITKGDGQPGAMYRLPQQLRRDGLNTATRTIDVPPSITDGAYELSATGQPRLVLTDYWQLHRFDGTGWVSALGPLQLQREALAWPWLPDGQPNDEVLLGAEGVGSTIRASQVP